MRAMMVAATLSTTLALAACATTTPTQRLTHLDAQFSEAVRTATALCTAKTLTDAQCADLDDEIQQGNDTLDAAWAALGTPTEGGTLQLIGMARRILQAIEQQLPENTA